MTPAEASSWLNVILEHAPLIVIAGAGGLVLFCMSLVEHFNRAEEDKLGVIRYLAFFVFLCAGLPALGVLMVGIYLLNGDQLSPLLAFQVGLTSPAIVQSLMVATANKMASSGVGTADETQ